MKILHILTKYLSYIILFAVLTAMMLVSLKAYNNNYERIEEKINSIDTENVLRCEITSFPARKSSDRTTFYAKLLTCEEKALKGAIIYFSAKDMPLFPEKGDIIELGGRLQTAAALGNEGAFDYKEYLKSQNCAGVCYTDGSNAKLISSEKGFFKAIYKIRKSFITAADSTLSVQNASLLKAVLTGDRTGIDDKCADAFKKSGIYHIVAISGLHLNLFICIVFYAISRLKLKRIKKAIVSLIAATITGGFVLIFTGMGISVIRAFMMMLIFSAASLIPRRSNSKHALVMTAFLILIVMPYSIYSVSFWLSCLSTMGVLISVDVIKIMKQRKMLRPFAESYIGGTVTVSAMTTLLTLPVTLTSFGYIPIYSWLANALVIPVMSYFLGFGVCFAVITSIAPGILSQILGFVITALSEFIIWTAKTVSSLPYAIFDTYLIYFVIIIFALAVFLIYWYTYVKRGCRYAVAVLCIFSVLSGMYVLFAPAKDEICVTFADVGQGDCAIAELSGQSIMIDSGTHGDGGYAAEAISATLRAKNIRALDMVAVSHFHSDHMNILPYLIESGKVKALAIPRYFDPTESDAAKNKEALLYSCIKSNTKIYYLSAGSHIELGGGAVIDVISPDKAMFCENNDMSVILKLSYGEADFLFCGDAEDSGIENIIGKDIGCDILKIPHHGGKSKNLKLLIDKCGAKAAVISCGLNNSYNHPDEKTLEALKNSQTNYYRTDQSGAVTVRADKKGNISIETTKKSK